MAGILKVDKYQDFNGNDIMTSDGSGNITINAAALKMTPAFHAYDSGQDLPDNTWTKINLVSTKYNVGSGWDTSTSKFTVPSGEAGTYVFYGQHRIENDTGYIYSKLYKNGSADNTVVSQNTAADYNSVHILNTFDLAVGDYIEYYAYNNVGNTNGITTINFIGYKLIGV